MSKSWVPVSEECDFSLQNLPYGVFSKGGDEPRCGVAIGDEVVDLSLLADAGLFDTIEGLDQGCFANGSLNAFMAHESRVWKAVRARMTSLLADGGDAALQNNAALQAAVMTKLADISMHMPAQIGDYTDFYSSREHATNVGTMFRGKDNALQPNWLHLPVGYHGRASSVFKSGTPVVRPRGQLVKDAADFKQGSVFGNCKLMDFELEVAFFVGGPPSPPATPITMEQAEDRIFGLVMMNDWSARDIQKWEYVPLGPFGAKNFATSISSWVVSLEALEPYRCKTSAVAQDNPVPLPYLQDPNYGSYDIDLTVQIQGEKMTKPEVVSKSNFRNMYWNCKQQLVHHSVTGCNMQPGDLLGSGTISGTPEDSFGSMLELCWKGTRTVKLGESGEVRKFLADGDTVSMSGVCSKPGVGRVGFGAVVGKVLPAGSSVDEAAKSEEKSESPAKSRYSDFTLHGYWRSSSTWRVRVALACKGIAYETVPVHLVKLEQAADDHSKRNPMQQLPTLEFKDNVTNRTVTISQSLAIIEFLHDAFPSQGGTLLGGGPLRRVAAREMAEVVNSGIQPLQNLKTFTTINADSKGAMDGKAFGAKCIREGLIALEVLCVKAHATDATGPFACGTSGPTVADACIVPQLYNGRRFKVDLDAACPTLLKVEEACAAHPWFKAAHPDVQPDAQPDAAAVEPASKKAKH